jgi:hypothetical protein
MLQPELMPDLAAFANALDRRRLDYTALLSSLTFPRPLESEVSAFAYEEFLPDQPDQALALEECNALVGLAWWLRLTAVLARRSKLPYRFGRR